MHAYAYIYYVHIYSYLHVHNGTFSRSALYIVQEAFPHGHLFNLGEDVEVCLWPKIEEG